MTKQSTYTEATQFSAWLRKQSAIDSRLGYIATDIDYIWENYNTNLFILLEEKRKMHKMTWSQEQQFKKMDYRLRHSKYYQGFYLIQFENTNPDDGKIFWNNKEISKTELIQNLKFKDINIETSYFK